jgi:hypothetical protein
MNFEIEDYVGELRKLREENKKLNILMEQYKNSKIQYFICGEYGARDVSGLPKNILVCPTLGLDDFAVYERVYQFPDNIY